MGIYLDYNASAPIDMRVLDVMISVYKNVVGNADSRTHDYGKNARIIIENARNSVATLAGIKNDEIFFTSGATESNNIAIRGIREYGEKINKKHIIISAIEHKAVIEAANSLIPYGFEIEQIEPEVSGRINPDTIIDRIREDTLMISVMHVNNETGIIQPIMEIGQYLEDRDILFHVDATQSFGKLVNEIQKLKYDMMSLSAHKFGGPQGIGALILRKKGYRLPPVKPLMYGGAQEHGIRPGTVPVALVAGLGEACDLSLHEYELNNKKCSVIREGLLEILEQSKLKYKINGDSHYCIPGTLNVCLFGVASEALMLASKQYCGISNGSACNSHKYAHSYVLQKMGIPAEEIENSIRISWGANLEYKDIIEQFTELINVSKGLIF